MSNTIKIIRDAAELEGIEGDFDLFTGSLDPTTLGHLKAARARLQETLPDRVFVFCMHNRTENKNPIDKNIRLEILLSGIAECLAEYRNRIVILFDENIINNDQEWQSKMSAFSERITRIIGSDKEGDNIRIGKKTFTVNRCGISATKVREIVNKLDPSDSGDVWIAALREHLPISTIMIIKEQKLYQTKVNDTLISSNT